MANLQVADVKTYAIIKLLKKLQFLSKGVGCMSYYPSWVYSPREDVTKKSMEEYDKTKEIFYKKCEEINPDYYKLSLKERMTVRDEAEKVLGYRR